LIIPHVAFYWMSYEKSRSLLATKVALNEGLGQADVMAEFKMAFAAGAMSGMVSLFENTSKNGSLG
jgi:hypothetical protein